MLLSVTGVSKQFGRNTVLENAGFSVREGEILGLIGPNGAGKTTLFECLAGLIAADGGTVRFRDRELPPDRRKQALHYLPDTIRPWPDQPVRWVLSFFAALHGRPRGEADRLAGARRPSLLCRIPWGRGPPSRSGGCFPSSQRCTGGRAARRIDWPPRCSSKRSPIPASARFPRANPSACR